MWDTAKLGSWRYPPVLTGDIPALAHGDDHSRAHTCTSFKAPNALPDHSVTVLEDVASLFAAAANT